MEYVTFEATDLSRCKAGKFSNRPTNEQEAARHSHHRLRSGERIYRSGNAQTHPLPGTQEFDGNSTIYEHQHSFRKRFPNDSSSILNLNLAAVAFLNTILAILSFDMNLLYRRIL